MSTSQLSDDTPLDPDDELLVTYLDGELDRKGQTELENRLLEDQDLRSRLQQLQTGWDLLDDPRAEVVWSGYNGVTATDGGYMLDLDASPGNMSLGQVLDSAVDGQVYTVSFDAADPRMNNGVDVYWGGELVGSANPTGNSMQSYSFEIQGGSGDGSNLLMITGTGPEDNVGAYIDNVHVGN